MLRASLLSWARGFRLSEVQVEKGRRKASAACPGPSGKGGGKAQSQRCLPRALRERRGKEGEGPLQGSAPEQGARYQLKKPKAKAGSPVVTWAQPCPWAIFPAGQGGC